MDAVRSRVKRGTIEHVREGGRVYIMLGGDQGATRYDQATDQDARPGELVEELRERVRYLERQVEEERDANRENRRLLAAALERIPAIEAPESPETAEPRSDRGTTPEEQEEPTSQPQEETRSWWRRMFGT